MEPKRINDLARGSCAVLSQRLVFALSMPVANRRERRDRKCEPWGIKGLSYRFPNDMCKVELRFSVVGRSPARTCAGGCAGAADLATRKASSGEGRAAAARGFSVFMALHLYVQA